MCSISVQQAFLTAINTSPASQIAYSLTQDIPTTFTTLSTASSFVPYNPPMPTVVTPEFNTYVGTLTLMFVQTYFMAAIPLVELFSDRPHPMARLLLILRRRQASGGPHPVREFAATKLAQLSAALSAVLVVC
jgi:hypothetical protein